MPQDRLMRVDLQLDVQHELTTPFLEQRWRELIEKRVWRLELAEIIFDFRMKFRSQLRRRTLTSGDWAKGGWEETLDGVHRQLV